MLKFSNTISSSSSSDIFVLQGGYRCSLPSASLGSLSSPYFRFIPSGFIANCSSFYANSSSDSFKSEPISIPKFSPSCLNSSSYIATSFNNSSVSFLILSASKACYYTASSNQSSSSIYLISSVSY